MTAGENGIASDAFPDRPYRAVDESGRIPNTTHVLELSADGSFTGYAACGEAPSGWVWSPSGKVSCRACRRIANDAAAHGKAAPARTRKGRR